MRQKKQRDSYEFDEVGENKDLRNIASKLQSPSKAKDTVVKNLKVR